MEKTRVFRVFYLIELYSFDPSPEDLDAATKIQDDALLLELLCRRYEKWPLAEKQIARTICFIERYHPIKSEIDAAHEATKKGDYSLLLELLSKHLSVT